MHSARVSVRYSNQVSFSFLVWMVVFAIVVSGFGVYYSVLKSKQVVLRTEISKIQREVATCRMNSNQYRAKTNALTNRWAMRDRLSQDGSDLRDIERAQIEVARSSSERLTQTARR